MIKQIVLSVLLAGGFSCGGYFNGPPTKIEEHETDISAETFSQEVAPMGLYANVSVNLTMDATSVYATAKNEFTLFPCTVATTVKLYSSETYTEDIGKMHLEASNSIDDLDMGHSITAKKDFGGRTLYWRGVVTYRVDDGAEKTIMTKIYHVSAD